MQVSEREIINKICHCLQIMKDMERWAKIQNRQKESVRASSPVLKGGFDDDRKQSKSADAGFAIFERKVGTLIASHLSYSSHLWLLQI